MSNPTSNFGWVMPTSTDLVTDLPADFAVFGQGVDTTMADLKGGTSGQILSKATNTDMDFTWTDMNPGDITGVTAGTGISGGGTSGTVTITNSMATEITAKGDLIVGTGSATFDNLAAGANGSTIVADSAATTGLRYSATPSASNPILNSAYQVAQRGTSFTIASSTATYTLDRWQAYRTATGMTVTQQNTGDTTNLPFIQKCVRLARDSGTTSTAAIQYIQTMESVNSIPFAGKTITLSFYARAGANYSPTSSALLVYLQTGTGTDQNYINGFTGATNIVSGSTATLTTTWQRFTFTATVGATATQLAMALNMNPTGTAGANDYCEVTGWQIDVGSVALPFRTYAATIQGELAACQRYYWRTGSGADSYSAYTIGFASSTTNAFAVIVHPVNMRVVPTSLDYSTLLLQDGTTGLSVSSAALSQQNQKFSEITLAVTGATAFRPYRVINNNSTSGYIGFNAEL